jgi:hypothetical protein
MAVACGCAFSRLSGRAYRAALPASREFRDVERLLMNNEWGDRRLG